VDNSPYMSRSGGIAATLRSQDFSVRSIPPSGDCFYDVVDNALPAQGRLPELQDPGAMRRFVASQLTQEIFETYAIYGAAGVDDYSFMVHHRAPADLAAVRAHACVEGKEKGAGSALWADEFAMSSVAALAGAALLIVDEQASRPANRRDASAGGGTEGRPDGRFVMLGEPAAQSAILLHRSRGQHISAILHRGEGLVAVAELPPPTRALWPALNQPCELAAAGGDGGGAGGGQGGAGDFRSCGDASETSLQPKEGPPPRKKKKRQARARAGGGASAGVSAAGAGAGAGLRSPAASPSSPPKQWRAEAKQQQPTKLLRQTQHR